MSATDVRRIGHFLALAFATGQVLAQNPPAITDADIERARRETPTVTDEEIEAARRKYALPSEAERPAAPVPSGPNIDALPQPAARSPIDLEALARGYASQVTDPAGLQSGPTLLVFVSLSMPQPTLTRLIDQASRARATVLIRGLANGSLRDTVAQVQVLIGSRPVAVQIDPRAFDRYAVTRVPSFVLTRDGTQSTACASGRCAPAESYLRASGDVSLDYALEHMQRSAPRFAPDAAVFLRRLKG